MFFAPLPNALVHVHGAVFTLWILLFITQTSLVAAGHTNWHRRLGLFGAAIACLVVILGVLAPTEFLANHGASNEHDVLRNSRNYALALSDVLMFAVLIACAIWYRGSPMIHKRLALIGTLSIIDAAYDRWSTRTVQPATIWATALLVVVQQGRDPLGHTAVWQAFTSWVYVHAQGFWLSQLQHVSIR